MERASRLRDSYGSDKRKITANGRKLLEEVIPFNLNRSLENGKKLFLMTDLGLRHLPPSHFTVALNGMRGKPPWFRALPSMKLRKQ